MFKTFKACLKACITNYMIVNGKTTLTKKDALTISTLAWKEGIVEKAGNILAGFKAGGMYPLSFPAMQTRFRLFQDGGIKASYQKPEWLQAREVVRTEVLALPPAIDRNPRRRKTLDVQQRLLSREQLQQLDE